jgi:hypothetical protein
VGIALVRVGEHFEALGEGRRAGEAYRKALAIFNAGALGPAAREAARDSAAAQVRLGRLCLREGRLGEAGALLEAASRATRIWDGAEEGGAWTRTVSQHVMTATHEVAAKADDETLAVPAGELRAVQEALQSALRVLRRLER